VFVSDHRSTGRLDISVAFPAMPVNWHYYRMSSPEHGWCSLFPLGETSGLAIEKAKDGFFWKIGNQGSTYADQHPTKVKLSTTSLPVFRETRSS